MVIVYLINYRIIMIFMWRRKLYFMFEPFNNNKKSYSRNNAVAGNYKQQNIYCKELYLVLTIQF